MSRGQVKLVLTEIYTAERKEGETYPSKVVTGYVVRKITNSTQHILDQELTKTEVDDLMRSGVVVDIVQE